jgi:hypothetical protein
MAAMVSSSSNRDPSPKESEKFMVTTARLLRFLYEKQAPASAGAALTERREETGPKRPGII